jgi:hypothetical protein
MVLSRRFTPNFTRLNGIVLFAITLIWGASAVYPVNAISMGILYLRDLPEAFVIPDGHLLELHFEDARILAQGDIRLFQEDSTEVAAIIRLINRNNLFRIYYYTSPTTFSSLLPLANPNFIMEVTEADALGFLAQIPLLDLNTMKERSLGVQSERSNGARVLTLTISIPDRGSTLALCASTFLALVVTFRSGQIIHRAA